MSRYHKSSQSVCEMQFNLVWFEMSWIEELRAREEPAYWSNTLYSKSINTVSLNVFQYPPYISICYAPNCNGWENVSVRRFCEFKPRYLCIFVQCAHYALFSFARCTVSITFISILLNCGLMKSIKITKKSFDSQINAESIVCCCYCFNLVNLFGS